MTAPPRWSPLLPWLPPLAAGLAQLGVARASWGGERYPGFPTLASDTLNAQKLSLDTLAAIRAAWDRAEGISGAAHFLAVDLWRAAVESRALNWLDMALLTWPLRSALPIGQALTIQAVALVVLAAVGGQLFARALGAGPAGRAAAGAVAGGAGDAVTCAARGQVPQALIAPTLLSLAGLWRLREGRRGGAALAGGGLALAALLYWQAALILAVGWSLFAAGAQLAQLRSPEPRRLRWLVRAGLAGLAGALACLPAAWPLLGVAGDEPLLEVLPWGTPFPRPWTQAWTDYPRAGQALYDSVPAGRLLSPTRGWLAPAAPLLPLLWLGVRGRWRAAAPWLALLLCAGLVLGPLPQAPTWWGAPMPGLDAEPRVVNPLYDLVFHWLPTASRMHHPLRWGVLVTAGLCALAAAGADRLFASRPRLTAALVVAGLAQAAALGPWPLPTSPLPGHVEAALRPCSELLFPAVAEDPWFDHARAHLSGVAWRPMWPPPDPERLPFAGPIGPSRREADARTRDLVGIQRGRIPPDLPPGACLILDPAAHGAGRERAEEALTAAFGEHEVLALEARLLYPGHKPRRLWVWRVP